MIYKGYDIEESPMGGFPVYYKSDYCFVGETLSEAKELVEAAPKVVAEALGKDAAETAQKQIEEAGGKAELK